jgi:hypothetical protein
VLLGDNIEKNAGGLTNLIAIVAGGFVALLIFVPVIIPMSIWGFIGGFDRKIGCYAGLGGFIGVVWMGMGAMIIVHSMYADSFFVINEAKVQNLTIFNSCSDAFTKVNADFYAKIIADEESTMEIITAFGWCLISLGIALCLTVFISVGRACYG